MAEFVAGNLYDANKVLVEKNEHPIKGKALENRLHNEALPYLNEKIFDETYFMLLCNEKKDYTIFHVNDKGMAAEKIIDMLKVCLHNRGVVYGIDRTTDTLALEIWIKHDDGDMACYYFFPYTEAVVEI